MRTLKKLFGLEPKAATSSPPPAPEIGANRLFRFPDGEPLKILHGRLSHLGYQISEQNIGDLSFYVVAERRDLSLRVDAWATSTGVPAWNARIRVRFEPALYPVDLGRLSDAAEELVQVLGWQLFWVIELGSEPAPRQAA